MLNREAKVPYGKVNYDRAAPPGPPNPVTEDRMATVMGFLAELSHKAAVYDAIKREYAILYEEEWGQVTVPPRIQEFLVVVGQCVNE